MKKNIRAMYLFIVLNILGTLYNVPLYADNLSASIISIYNISNDLIPLLILLMFFINIVICLILYAFFQKKVHLYITLISGVLVIHALSLCPHWYDFQAKTMITAMLICMTITPLLFCIIYQHIYRVFLRRLNIMLVIFFLFPVSALLLMQVSGKLHELMCVLFLVTMISAILVSAWFTSVLYRLSPDRKIYVIVLFFLIPYLFITLDMFYYMLFPRSYTPAGFLMFPSLVLGMHFLDLHSICEKKTVKIVLFVRDATIYPNGTGRVASQHCQIMETVIGYIQNNYACPLTREDLADVVRISPDYLGRMFQKYTGKRIKEYINEYRINESARLIGETDHSFTHIAYEVGFECIGTFNRYFQKIFGMSPGVYRNKITPVISSSMIEVEQGSCHPDV
jgi:AraC-like DNA-binding protein